MKENWTYKKLGEIAKISSGKAIPSCEISETLSDGFYPCYGGNGLRGYVDHYSHVGLTPVIGRVGALCGNVHLPQDKFYATEHALVVILKTNDKPHFIEYILGSLNLRQYAKGVAQPVLSASSLSDIPIPIPPMEEQERIVAELDLLQSVIDKKKAQLDEYDKLAQSIFYDMFGDPVDNEKGWEMKKLGEVCLLKAGKAIKASELSDNNAPSLYPCYGGNGIRGYINKYSHTESYPIVGRQGALCGNVNYAEAPFYATEHAVVAKPIKAIDTKWLFFQLKFMRLNQYAHGVAQPGLAVQDLEPLDCVLPPLSLQQSFAEKIEAIEHQKELVKQSLNEVKTLFDSRMDYYFN
jgi:type I restriction enzyme S subunit